MNERAIGTMARADKGPVLPPPALEGPLQAVADAVAGWAGVIATVHWDPFRMSRVDGVDFYLGEDELGHLHLDGSVHLATSPGLGRILVAEGLARPLPYLRGWVEEQVQRVGSNAAVALFRRNYERLLRMNPRAAAGDIAVSAFAHLR
jgi:luciferase-like monooxygenase